MIRLRRGQRENLPTLAGGEPGICLDTGELFVGCDRGNVKINGPWVTPETYGAKGDGTTNDSSAIQSSHDSLPATGGAIVLAAKEYAIGTAISISKPNVSIFGVSRGSVLTTGGTRIKWIGSSGGATNGMIYVVGNAAGTSAHYFNIENVSLDGDSKANICLKCESLASASYCKSPSGRNLEFSGYKTYGLVIGDDVTMNNPGGQGIASFRGIRFYPTVTESVSIIVNAQNFEITNLDDVYIDGEIHERAIYHRAGGLSIRNLITTRTTLANYAVYSYGSCMIDGWRSEDKLLFDRASTGSQGPTVLRNVWNRQGFNGTTAYTLATEYPIRYTGTDAPLVLNGVYTRGNIYISGNAAVSALGVTFCTNIRCDRYEWTESGSGTNEYYLSVVGGGSSGLQHEPAYIAENEVRIASGTVGSLTVGTWGWGDNDTLGYDTVYIRLTDESDPDSQVTDFVKAIGASTFSFANYGQGAVLNETDKGRILLQGEDPYISIVESSLSAATEQSRTGKINAFIVKSISGATPDISDGTHFMLSQSGATNVTNFTGSYNETSLGQLIFVTFLDGNSTLKFSAGTSLIGNNNDDWTPAAGEGMVAYNTYSAALGWHWDCIPIKKSTATFSTLSVASQIMLGGTYYLIPDGDHLKTSFNVYSQYVDDAYLYFSGGNAYNSGARLVLYGGSHDTDANKAHLEAVGGVSVAGDVDILSGYALKVDGTQVVGAQVVDADFANTPNSGDTDTDDLIDKMRDALISHGLISAT